jgi:hypothetical protein
MSRHITITIALGLAVLIYSMGPETCQAKKLEPEAPTSLSWFPHGYGGNMDLDNSYMRRRKAIHGLRMAPSHTGAVGQPLWGWDTNGFYRGPQELEPDPGECQLPIGLIYPCNGQALPPPKKVVRKGASKVRAGAPPRRLIFPNGRAMGPMAAGRFAPPHGNPVYGPGYSPHPRGGPMAPVIRTNNQAMAPVMGMGNATMPGTQALPPAQPMPRPAPYGRPPMR